MREGAVAITGFGLVTALGASARATWEALLRGESGVRSIERFPVDHLVSSIAATLDHLGNDFQTCQDRCLAATRMAIAEAVDQSGYGAAFPGPLVIATSPFDHEWDQRLERLAPNMPEADIAPWDGRRDDETLVRTISTSNYVHELLRTFGIKHVPLQLHNACASGSSAVQVGCELVRRGKAETVLVAAADTSVNPESITKFALLGALSKRNEDPAGASRPFTRSRDGFVMAEATAAMILETPAAARARGAVIHGYALGCGESVDIYHRTRSDPEACAISKVMTRALKDAGLPADAVDYINAHGTSTPDNDWTESLGIRKVFGNTPPPVSSNKSMLGHALSASGLVEAVVTVLTLKHGILPPTINYHDPDPEISLDVVPNKARPMETAVAMSNSFGFGGQNVSLVFGRGEG